ncbi:hypothetical protein L21SP5_00887 [Salinivirga cyanobacteriivorans]|uniref:Uncharacterized protein n=1 Tax=Salinivirga cyanobacteriivorans TaxID=1307839 RepID=A0A0S2HXN2_9BACT|nr:hypothetical protein L21SP5_00887 [Salinivirga cyanobacteriivorans]
MSAYRKEDSSQQQIFIKDSAMFSEPPYTGRYVRWFRHATLSEQVVRGWRYGNFRILLYSITTNA